MPGFGEQMPDQLALRAHGHPLATGGRNPGHADHQSSGQPKSIRETLEGAKDAEGK
jgi:hypothetical protein